MDMQEKVHQLLCDEDHEIRMIIVRSLHEIFKLMGDDEDTGLLRICFQQVLETRDKLVDEFGDNRGNKLEVERLEKQHNSLNLELIAQNIDCIFDLYVNAQALDNVNQIF